MSWASVTYIFSPSTTAKSTEVNQNYTDLVNAIDTAMPSDTNGHGIILWSGSIATIPSGWYLCDGSNGTPDLQGKFVRGAGGSYSVGATGGNETIDLSHSHTVNSHSHTMAHTHTYSGTTSGGNGSVQVDSTNEEAVQNSVHTHTYSGTTSGSSASNTGTASPGTNTQLSATQNILPPFYTLAYIMKS